MNKNQINKKEMYDAVSSYLDSKSAIWASIPKVGEFKNEFSAVLAQIDAVQYEQQQAQVFLGKTKKQIKSVVAEKADILNDSLEAFAG
jgi:predicted transcriptional regulator